LDNLTSKDYLRLSILSYNSHGKNALLMDLWIKP